MKIKTLLILGIITLLSTGSIISAENLNILKTAVTSAYTTAFSLTMFAAAFFALITLVLILKIPKKPI